MSKAEQKTSFRHAYTTEIASHVQATRHEFTHESRTGIYVNRTRPKYIYTPGAFTSSFERRFPHFRCTPPPLSTAIIPVLYLHVSVRHTWIFRNIISLDEFDFPRPLFSKIFKRGHISDRSIDRSYSYTSLYFEFMFIYLHDARIFVGEKSFDRSSIDHIVKLHA